MCFFFFNDTATTEIYTLSLHDALPISEAVVKVVETTYFGKAFITSPNGSPSAISSKAAPWICQRSEEHTSELQSRQYLVCRLLLEKKKEKKDADTVRDE